MFFPWDGIFFYVIAFLPRYGASKAFFFFLFPCWYWVLSARYHHTVARHTFGCTRCFSLIAAWPECVFFLAYLLEHVCVHMVYLESPGTRLSVLVVLVGSILVRPEGLACDGAKASSGRFGDIYPRRGRRGYGFARVPYFCIFRELSLRPRWTAVAALRLRKISSLCMVRLYQVCIDI